MGLTHKSIGKPDHERVLDICISAFTPYHRFLEETLGSNIFAFRFHDWREPYSDYLAKISDTDPAVNVHVVVDGGTLAASVFSILDSERQMAEIGLNAVDPVCQGKGIGKMMYEFALTNLKERGGCYPCSA